MDKIYIAGPSITKLENETVRDAMENHWYEQPYDYVENFQKEFAKYHDRKFGIMTPNCTSAIHLLLTALGISEGDEVIVPECTWIASAAPLTYLKATPVFCDIEESSWCLSPKSVESNLTDKTKAIIAVDLFGNMPNMEALLAISARYGIPLVEDAAEALGSTLNGVKAGKFGIGSVFSFHRTKTLTTGEGGMLILDDENLFQRCMFLRDHGRKADGPMYYNYEVTYKYMPFNVQAALGYAQFQRLEELVEIKRRIFKGYVNNLSDIDDIQLNEEPEGGINGVWATGLIFGKSHNITKLEAIDMLQKYGVPTRPFFYPLSSLPAYPGAMDKYRQKNTVSYDISARGINLPCAMNLSDEQVRFISACVREILNK